MSLTLLHAAGPAALCALAAVVVMVLEIVGRRTAAVYAGAVGLLAAGVLALVRVAPATGGDAIIVGGKTSVVAGVLAIVASLLIVAGGRRSTSEPTGAQGVALVCFGTAASLAALASGDLIWLIIALETAALVGYAIVARPATPRADGAALRYFVQGAAMTGILLFGAVGLIAMAGGSGYPALALLGSGGGSVVATAALLVLAALAFKAGAFPLHTWAPDAYEAATPWEAGYLATVPKSAALMAAVVLFGQALPGAEAAWMPALWLLAVGSIVYGTLVALRQRTYTRMLAYSGIAQTGYVLTALTAGADGLLGAIAMAVSYSIASAAAFAVAEAVRTRRPDWDGSIEGMAGIGASSPLLGISLTVVMLSLTGIPLTFGFWGKFLAFGAAIGSGSGWLAAVALVASVVSFGFYGSVLKSVYFTAGPAAETAAPRRRVDAATVAVAVAAACLLAAGIIPLVLGLGTLTALMP
jgi:NADH-quinone oxidoreductase subunit N